MEFSPSEENIFDHLNQAMGESRANLKILEEQIDIALQMEYFKLASAIRKNPSDYDAINLEHEPAFDTLAEQPDLYKPFLIQLAQSADPRSFKWIEEETRTRTGILRSWAVLALQESRMVLESDFLDENQVFISTGLGGKENRLRYFVVFITNENGMLSDLQKSILEKECGYLIREHKAELEEIRFEDQFTFITCLLTMETNLKPLFRQLIDNCNVYGDFLSNHFILTNLKILTTEEARQYFEKK